MDFYSCDHFVDLEHCLGNIKENQLVELLESPTQRAFWKAKLEILPRYCGECEVRAPEGTFIKRNFYRSMTK